MEHELVSVTLCTYNGMKFIGPQLVSIQKQSYSPIEIIIVDDCSTDGTYEWLKAEAEKDNRIRLFRNQNNLGFNFNFNKACSYAKGEFIAIADQDDIWDESKLSILVSAIKQRKDNIMAHCISAKFKKEDKPNLKNHKLMNHFSGNDSRQFFLSNRVAGHNMLFKKELLKTAMPFPGEGYYDWWLVVHACCIGRIEAVEEILVWHRRHENNATSKAKQMILFHEQVQGFLPHILSIKNLPENYRAFGEQLLECNNELDKRRFSGRLFKFLIKNAPVIFAYKKRAFPWISYTKHAFKLSKVSVQ